MFCNSKALVQKSFAFSKPQFTRHIFALTNSSFQCKFVKNNDNNNLNSVGLYSNNGVRDYSTGKGSGKKKYPSYYGKQPEELVKEKLVIPETKAFSLRLFNSDRAGMSKKWSFRRKYNKPTLFAMWTAFCCLAAVGLSSYDDSAERSISFSRDPELFWRRLYCTNPVDVGFMLEAAVRVLTFSASARDVVAKDTNVIMRLFEIIDNEHYSVDIREKAGVCLIEMCKQESSAKILGENKMHLKLLQSAFKIDSLTLRQMLTQCVCYFADDESLCPELAENGGITYLEVCNASKSFGSQSHKDALMKISLKCQSIPAEERFKEVFEGEWDRMEKYADEYKSLLASPYYETITKIRKTGVHLYLHTAGGGFVWGLIEGYMLNNTPLHILQYAGRNALVSSLIPIYFVGASVGTFTYFRSKCENAVDMFCLYTVSGMAIFPWFYIMPRVERYSPYWIGGHVLGFISFVCWLKYSRSDLLTNSYALKMNDMKVRDRKQLKN